MDVKNYLLIYGWVCASMLAYTHVYACVGAYVYAHMLLRICPRKKTNKKERFIKKEINKESSYNYINILILVYPHKNERSE